VIILTSSQPEGLLETIVSRVQIVQFRRLSAAEIRAGLALRAAARPEADRELVVPLADGSLGRALELLDGDLRTWRAAVVSGLGKLTPRTALQFGLGLWTLASEEGTRLFASEKGTDAPVTEDDAEGEESGKAAEGAAKTEAGWRRYVFRRLLEVCEVCFRDGMIHAASGNGNAALLQPDQQELSRALAARFGESGCAQVLAALREATLATRLYVRGDVVGRAFGGKLVDAMSSPA
jgi:hypothetical protein